MRDYIFKRLLFLCSLLVLLICGGMVYSLVSGAVPAFEKFGFFHFISSVEWDPRPGNEQYGALAFITGTIMTSFLALVFRFLYLWLYSPANISGVPGQPRSSVRSSTCWPVSLRLYTVCGDFIPSAPSWSIYSCRNRGSAYSPQRSY